MVVAGLCLLGVWYSWNLARADHLFRLDTAQSLHEAIRIEPDAWKYYMRLALLDNEHSAQLLETAIKLDSYDAEADTELGLRFEAVGDYSRAEKLLLDAFSIDRTFLPRWSLANFYFRRDNIPAFWIWARKAAEMPSDDMGSLFALCWHVSPDPNEITQKVLNNNPELIRQYLDFLLAKDQPRTSAAIARRLIQSGNPEIDRSYLFSAINKLVAAQDGGDAEEIWSGLIDKHWVAADAGAPNNPNFARDPLPVSFDWALPSYSGLHSWPGQSGLVTEFTATQPEQCTIAQQALVLAPGDYRMEFSYRTDGIAPATGLRWQILAANSDTPLAESGDLSSETLSRQQVAFSVPPAESLVYLRLFYHRALGTTRISGTVLVPSVQVQASH